MAKVVKIEKYKEFVNNNLMNCDIPRFMQTAYSIREIVERFDIATGINSIRSEKMDIIDGETEAEHAEREKRFINDKWSRMMASCFGDNYEVTVELLAKVYFTTPEEINNLQPYEINNLLLIMLSNMRIRDFFTSLKLWGLMNTGTTSAK